MIVKAKGIQKQFGDKIIFENFNITVQEGDSFVIIGESKNHKLIYWFARI